MEVLRHFHPFFAFPGAWRVFGEKRQGSRKGLAFSSPRRSAGLPASSMACRRKAGEASPALVGFSFPGEKVHTGGAQAQVLSGCPAFSGKISPCRTAAASAAQAPAVPAGKKRLHRARKRVCTARKNKRFIFVHPAPSALWTGPDEDLFNTGTAFAPQLGARRRQRPGAEFGSVNHSPQHGRNPCSCIIP